MLNDIQCHLDLVLVTSPAGVSWGCVTNRRWGKAGSSSRGGGRDQLHQRSLVTVFAAPIPVVVARDPWLICLCRCRTPEVRLRLDTLGIVYSNGALWLVSRRWDSSFGVLVILVSDTLPIGSFNVIIDHLTRLSPLSALFSCRSGPSPNGQDQDCNC